jgi:tetratricopeptide (TPR) repeat protein
MDMLRQAIARDPEFARAHSRLATMAVLSRLYLNLPDADAIVEKEASAASALDPGLAEPHAARAQALAIRRQFVQAFAEFDRALALDPDDVTARFWHAIGLIQCGYTQRGNAELDRVLATDPLLPNGLYWRGMGYLYAGDRATAQRMLQRSADAGLAFSGLGQSIASHEAGDDEAARRQLAAGLNGGLSMEFTADDIELLVRGVFGAPAERAAAVAWIDRKVATAPKPVNGMYPHLLLRLHEPARALAVSGAGTNNDASLLPMLWSPYGSELRALPQFPAYLRQMHLAQTWDALGPPDLCTRAAAGGWRCR